MDDKLGTFPAYFALVKWKVNCIKFKFNFVIATKKTKLNLNLI